MSRRAARALHLALFLLGFVLYVVFVLPRWWVLTGAIPSTLATAGRIATGFPIALAGLPVLQILRGSLTAKPPTPEIALRLRAWSAVLHAVAGALILLAAIAEIWLSLAAGGPWLFAVYGAAGTIAILGFLALYLSFVAEQPPAAPKPPKPKKVKPAKVVDGKDAAPKKPRGKKRDAALAAESVATPESAAEEAETTAVVVETVIESGSEETPDTATVVVEPDVVADEEPVSAGALRNKRPAGKRRHRLGR